jgi:hypothetical protein
MWVTPPCWHSLREPDDEYWCSSWTWTNKKESNVYSVKTDRKENVTTTCNKLLSGGSWFGASGKQRFSSPKRLWPLLMIIAGTAPPPYLTCVSCTAPSSGRKKNTLAGRLFPDHMPFGASRHASTLYASLAFLPPNDWRVHATRDFLLLLFCSISVEAQLLRSAGGWPDLTAASGPIICHDEMMTRWLGAPR